MAEEAALAEAARKAEEEAAAKKALEEAEAEKLMTEIMVLVQEVVQVE